MTPRFLDNWVCQQAGISPESPCRPAALQAYQIKALKRTLTHARACSRFYQERLAGFRVDSLQRPADLAGLPFTRPDQIRDQNQDFACLSQNRVARVFTLNSSGTTARPKRLLFTREDLDQTVDFFAACLAPLMGPEDRGLILLPGATPFSAGDLIGRAMKAIGAVPRIHGLVTDAEKAAREIRESRPCVLIGMPVQVLALGEMMARSGKGMPGISYAILTADHVSLPAAARISALFRCPILSHYGLTETGFGGAIQCPAGNGLHIRHPHLVVEIVAKETGDPLPNGEWGDIVVTTLGRTAMPLIRYRTGDVSRLLKGPCTCGSVFPCLDRIRNRQTEGIDLGMAAPLTMADLDDALFALDSIVDFTAVITGDENRPVLDLTAETISPLAPDRITACLASSGIVQKALAAGRLFMGQIRTRHCTFTPSYLGKRQILDKRNPHGEKKGANR